jgi:hypothetical protein
VISGAAPSLVGLPSGALVGMNDAALIEAGEQWRKRPSAFGLN